jgi:glyoxylase-like metal-dependent hydrolase (beta-lactamase superfamily II)
MVFNTNSGRYRIHVIKDFVSRCYLIESDQDFFLVDTGAYGNVGRIMAQIERNTQKALRLIFITHAHLDHYGSAKGIRDKTGAPIIVHERDAESMIEGKTRIREGKGWGKVGKGLLPLAEFVCPTPKTAPDFYLYDGHTFNKYGLDARVVHSPGHTPGSCCLLLEEKYLFVGDLIISRSRVYSQKYFADNWESLGKSLNKIKSTAPDFVFPGHGDPFDGYKLKEL